ncbi:MAG: alpha/beta hydrolase [Candidatus Aminicenantes bacterium]|nr:MAG: alpha/beta hydrolase [Candidatus Aminicenantes bacterium]
MKLFKDNLITMGQGTPVVLLHSSMSSKLQWYRLMQTMSRDHLMIAVDFYGCGGSPFPSNPETFSLGHEIALVESLLEGLIPGGKPFHIVGHSYGGAVGLRFTYKARERILSLTLFEPVAFHLLRGTDEEVLAKVIQLQETVNNYIKQNNYAAAAEYFIDYYNETGTFASYPKEMQDLLCVSAKKLPLGFQALVEEALSLEDYRNISIPVCLVTGGQSPINSRRPAELLADYLPNCRCHVVNGGHMVPLTQPELVNPIIESFIRRHSVQGPC